ITARWGRPLHELSLAEARELSRPDVAAATAGRSGHAGASADNSKRQAEPAGLAVREARVSCAGGSVPVRLLAPAGTPGGVIVYFHGGGWALGGVDEAVPAAARLARLTGCTVVCGGYRRAPEYRFPTALQDAWAVLGWAAGHLADLAATAGAPLLVAGEGAGGNLAAVTARWAAERGGPPVAAQVLLGPVTDADFDGGSYTDPASQVLAGRAAMMWFWDMYVPDEAARRHPDASPLQAMFLTGLPPAIVVTAEHDVLRDEGELYAMRLVQAGVPVEHQRFAGQGHGFAGLAAQLPGGQAALEFAAAAIRRRLQAGVSSQVSS
ncbi:MAG TPA: alpha/beta hydrolase, partial [Streptosporangiaceae bacterium]